MGVRTLVCGVRMKGVFRAHYSRLSITILDALTRLCPVT
jgi:hypothetical protein